MRKKMKLRQLLTQHKNVTASRCPACGHLVDSASALDGSDSQPKVGDIIFCVRCSTPLKFGYDFQLEHCVKEDLPKLRRALAGIQGLLNSQRK
jgi:hypothetical protein